MNRTLNYNNNYFDTLSVQKVIIVNVQIENKFNFSSTKYYFLMF